MRTILIVFAALLLSIASTAVHAQVRIHINLDSQPVWGPTGYDYVENYYLPDIDAYYNVPQHRYYYNSGGRWIGSSSLPSRYHNYDVYKSYKVVVNDRDPWRNHETYRDKYSSYKDRHDQEPIRDSRDSKYFVNKRHPEHQNWLRQQKHDNGNHNGRNKENNGRGKGNGQKEDDKQGNGRDK